MSDIGPALPPHLAAKRKRQQEEAEKAAAALKESEGKTSQDASTDTAIPPRKDVDENAEKRRRVIGPTIPAPIDQMPSRGPNDDEDKSDDESSDDDIGPSFPGAGRNAADEEAAAQRRLARYAVGGDKEQKITRDEWMIVPPKQEDWSSRVDPTKIKSRKFQTGKGAKGPSAKGGDNSLWTESVADKAKRVADEVMGVRKPASQADEDPAAKAARLEAEDTQRRIDDYNSKHRGKSLMDEYSGSKDKKEEDDPSKRAFDREKDIAGGGKKIGLQQKKQMLARAADFGSRFSKGSYL